MPLYNRGLIEMIGLTIQFIVITIPTWSRY